MDVLVSEKRLEIMKILFYTSTLQPYAGGIARVTDNIVAELHRRGYGCFGLYHENYLDDAASRKATYAATMAVSVDPEKITSSARRVAAFIQEHGIDVLINQQGALSFNIELCRQIKIFTGIPIITFFHSMPGHIPIELKKLPKMQPKRSLTAYVKSLLRPMYVIYMKEKYIHLARKGYAVSNKYVLLSQSYIRPFQQINRIKDPSKLAYINNSLTFDSYSSADDISRKEQIVLIVSRLEEGQKRISKAIHIWSNIERLGVKDWTLVIVGDGPHLAYYRQLAADLNLKHIRFEPATKNPMPYYQKASIFMMTSAFEGWGLTLLEASQMGCVPIVYDTFSAVHDIIKTGVNGVIVPFEDEPSYVNSLMDLMTSPNQRIQMGIQAVENSRRFTAKKIADHWETLINQVII